MHAKRDVSGPLFITVLLGTEKVLSCINISIMITFIIIITVKLK